MSAKQEIREENRIDFGGLFHRHVAIVLPIEQAPYPTYVRHRTHVRLDSFARKGIDPIARIRETCDTMLRPHSVTEYLHEQARLHPGIDFSLYDAISPSDGGAMMRVLSFLADKQPGRMPIFFVAGVGVRLLDPGFAIIIDNRLPQDPHSREEPFDRIRLGDKGLLDRRLSGAVRHPYLLDTEFDPMMGWTRHDYEL